MDKYNFRDTNNTGHIKIERLDAEHVDFEYKHTDLLRPCFKKSHLKQKGNEDKAVDKLIGCLKIKIACSTLFEMLPFPHLIK